MAAGPALWFREGRRPLTLLIGGAVAGIVLLWLAGLQWYAHTATRSAEPTLSDRRTDAIVVLTGGSGRVETGFHLLEQRVARTLFISGVHEGVRISELRATVDRLQGPSCCVVLGYEARDTSGNAVETAAWMAERGYRSLRLVTANYHMPRSLLEFRRAMPGIEIIPEPVSPDRVHLDRWWRWPGTAELLVAEYTKYLLARVRLAMAPTRIDAVQAPAGPDATEPGEGTPMPVRQPPSTAAADAPPAGVSPASVSPAGASPAGAPPAGSLPGGVLKDGSAHSALGAPPG